MTPFGVTPAQPLAYVSGTQFATLTWGTATTEQQVSVTPAGTTLLAIDVTPMPGGITFTKSGGALCGPGVLNIAATVRFVTSDGGFNETWQENLFSYDGQSLTFYHDLQRTPPTGSFRVTYTGTTKWDSIENQLTATFSDRGARGGVQFTTSMSFSTGPNSGGGGGLIVQAASWVPRFADAGFESGSFDAQDEVTEAEAGTD
jgi:hypothetical protein